MIHPRNAENDISVAFLLWKACDSTAGRLSSVGILADRGTEFVPWRRHINWHKFPKYAHTKCGNRSMHVYTTFDFTVDKGAAPAVMH